MHPIPLLDKLYGKEPDMSTTTDLTLNIENLFNYTVSDQVDALNSMILASETAGSATTTNNNNNLSLTLTGISV